MNKLFFNTCLALLLSTQTFALIPNHVHQELTEKAFNKSNNISQRWSALMEIAQSKNQSSLEVLKRASVDKDWFMRSGSLVGIEAINPKESYELAKKLIKDKSLLVRTSAFEIMQKQLKEEDRALLWTELNQKYNFRGMQSLWIRYQILEQLGQNPLGSEKKQFEALLKDSDPKIQTITTNILNKY